MIIFRMSKKHLKIFIILVLAVSFGINVYNFKTNRELSDKYNLLTCITNHLENASIITFLISMEAQIQSDKQIEIFDINNGCVIKRISPNITIQKEVENYLNGITGMYPKVKAFPDRGYIIRIPLKPSVNVENLWLDDLVDEVFIMFPEQEKPYMLILDDEKRPLFYNFEGNIDALLKYLDFSVNSYQNED